MIINYSKDIVKVQDKLKQKLSDSRYTHTLGVAYTAACLAMKYQVDVNSACMAGMLHDCAKYMSGDDMLKKAKEYKLEISAAEYEKPDLLHAKLGSYYAKNKYKIEDEQILSAIRFHTTGKPDMTLFEKIVYISDYIEPGRDKMPRLDVIRKEAFEDIDSCLKMILEDSVKYLTNSNMKIDNTTIDTYNFYCKE